MNRSRATVDHIQPVDGEDHLEPQITLIADDDGVAAALLADDEPAVAHDQARK